MGGHPVLVAGLVAAALVVGGCSSGAQGAPGPDAGTPPPSTSSAPSLSPSPTGVATLDAIARARIPKAARGHTPQGAEAFARFYLEQVNKAWMAPDPELIRPYALDACKTCANYVGTAKWLREGRLRYEGVPSTLGSSGVVSRSDTDDVVVQVAQVQEPGRILRQDGSLEQQLHKTASLLDVRLTWDQAAWRIASIKGEQA